MDYTNFIFVTLILGGLAAWMTGRAVALSWQGIPRLLGYCLLLACAVRFLHFALFHGLLISIEGFALDAIALVVIAVVGRLVTRRRQMSRQYLPFSAEGYPLTRPSE